MGAGQQAFRWRGIGTDSGFSRTKDSRLLPPDTLAAVTQPILMVELDTSDHRHIRIENVHRIQPATQPHFQYQDIHIAATKNLQRPYSAILNIRQATIAAGGINRRKRL